MKSLRFVSFLVIAFTVLTLGATQVASGDKTPGVPLDKERESLCKLLSKEVSCSSTTEVPFGNPPANAVSKTGKTLTILTRKGARKTWKDGDGETGTRYESVAYVKRHRYFLISGFHYETQSHELVSYETGTVYPLSGFPLFSPDVSHFAVEIIPYGSDPVSVEIHYIDALGISERAKFDITAIKGVGGLLWLSPEELAVLSQKYERATTRSFSGPPVLARIKRVADRWEITNSVE